MRSIHPPRYGATTIRGLSGSVLVFTRSTAKLRSARVGLVELEMPRRPFRLRWLRLGLRCANLTTWYVARWYCLHAQNSLITLISSMSHLGRIEEQCLVS